MATRAVNEHSPLLRAAPRVSSVGTRVRNAALSLTARVQHGVNRYRQPLLVVVAVVAAAIALLMAVVVFFDGPSVSSPLDSAASNEYDAIIIGGGPAGSVLSKLLADDPWRNVLLIEAGGASQVDLGGDLAVASPLNTQHLTPFDVPFYWTNVANTPELHWRIPGVSVAKALGGCGIHNAMLYVRALPHDLDRWAMPNWTWAKALSFYLEMEDFDGPKSTFHSTSGAVRTSPAGVRDPLSEQFIEACEALGMRRTHDFNAPHGRVGAGFYHFNTRDGVRESAARTFLGPMLQGHKVSQQANFRLLLHTTVTRVLISDSGDAQGVDVMHADGRRETIRLSASRKSVVVIAAGAINTPKVLQQSGVGDNATLTNLGIPVKKHLPRVGMNLQDHPVLGVTFESLMPTAFDLQSEIDLYFRARTDVHKSNERVNATHFGKMGSAGLSAGAFLIPPGSTAPEIQLTFFPRKSEPHISNSSELNHTAQLLFTVALLTPRARNRVVLERLNSTSDSDSSEYKPFWFVPRVVSEVPGDERPEHLRGDDVWKLSWGVRVVREIAAVLAARGLAGKELLPGASIADNDALNTWVLGAVFRNSHWVGTASMARSEVQGVVDARLRVFGVSRLRIADASVIPVIPNGNVHSSVLMVASHAAELIKTEEEGDKTSANG